MSFKKSRLAFLGQAAFFVLRAILAVVANWPFIR
ncbi:hypothetical protein DSM3645_07540 [Blastopirellula marina DSM 3645]|uniref:Uncharacterized protein n=1 Tax=Blastopirellula marina DSM 3645 TaxID=314230 RepID=A3ZXS9_9BACT|nr:hypothetical protein DSM3645_07540 [Blastopirellula marina DSM 3645]